jgi:coenzyme F420-0:L-glutamate ligase/coenzyme F420-1:gamma-L-glutamate ligase
MEKLDIFPVHGAEEWTAGMDMAAWITARFSLEEGDVVVVSSKAVSKAEGHMLQQEDLVPSAFAKELADRTGHDPVYCEAVLRESRDIVRMAPGVVICRTRHGFVVANAGVDASNCREGEYAILPPSPDSSAARIRDALAERTGKQVAVILSDTFGRAWRVGQTDLAVGVAGMAPLRNYRGCADRYGRELYWTCLADADELASAAELVRGKADGVPVVVIRGYCPQGSGSAADLVMPPERDLFR